MSKSLKQQNFLKVLAKVNNLQKKITIARKKKLNTLIKAVGSPARVK